jgi:hypothetical protein
MPGTRLSMEVARLAGADATARVVVVVETVSRPPELSYSKRAAVSLPVRTPSTNAET